MSDRLSILALCEHWWCPTCGTFDGPHDEGFCDVCVEIGRTPRQVEGLVRADFCQGVVPDDEQIRARWAEADKAVEQARRERDSAKCEVAELREELDRLRGNIRSVGPEIPDKEE